MYHLEESSLDKFLIIYMVFEQSVNPILDDMIHMIYTIAYQILYWV